MRSDSWYRPASRRLQDEFDSRRVADRLLEHQVTSGFSAKQRAFIERAPMFFLATADASGRPDCSHKGGPPGFVHVEDEHTLTFPDFDGNGMFRSLGNIGENPHVGLLFVDFSLPNRLRVNGTATIHRDAGLLARHPGAQLVVRVAVTDVFPNCPRYVHELQLVEESVYVPRRDRLAPVPDWKALPEFRDALPRRGLEALPTRFRAAAELRTLRWAQRRIVRVRKGANWILRRVENRLGAAAQRRADDLLR